MATDNANGWAPALAIENADRGLSVDVEAADQVHQARVSLNRLASEYNAKLESFPTSVVASMAGFTLWDMIDMPLQPENSGPTS